jgi:alkyl sulfatase BDS1-like metallo-beta-lactamase superfamily hydrolase
MNAKYIFLSIIIFFIIGCNKKKDTLQENYNSKLELHDHSKEFKKQIIKVGEKTYVAIGYGLANSIMIEGTDGLIIIDAMESLKQGETVIREFKEIVDKPVKAIIYTHNHADHVFGAKSIAGKDNPEIYAHELMPYYLDRISNIIRPIIEKRSYRMFGNFLNKDELVNCGIGQSLRINKNSLVGVIRPTKTFKDSLNIDISGIKLQLFHASGETPDQLMVWMPDEKILFCGDNFYKSFPNLYTIRGTAYRDVNEWKNSLDKMRSFSPEKLVPSHTLPIQGKTKVLKALTDYRDAIQYVHDQTIRLVNHGLTPDEIVEKISLPKHLAVSPYLQEFYGKVSWSVREIMNGYLGWFDGNPSSLNPLTLKEEALKIVELAGGKNMLKEALKKAIENKDYKWALQLADYLIVLDEDKKSVQYQKGDILYQMGMKQNNANARHYYVTYGKELKGLSNEALGIPDKDMVHSIPLNIIFNSMAVSLKAEEVLDLNKSITWFFPDKDSYYSMIIRKGIAEVVPSRIENSDITIELDSKIWKELLAEFRTPLMTFLSGKIKINGGKLAFIELMGYFEKKSEIKSESILLP